MNCRNRSSATNCRCDVCDCGQDDGRKTVSAQGVQRITSKETAQTKAQGPLRQTNTGAHENLTKRTPCKKNFGKKERTTSAEGTQNQHFQRARTVVESFLELLLVLRSVDMAGVYTPTFFPPNHGTEYGLNHADPCEVERKRKSEASARRPRGWHPCR